MAIHDCRLSLTDHKARLPSKLPPAVALCSSSPFFMQSIIMRLLVIATLAVMLSACVSAPSDLYGIHQAKPETPAATVKQMAATGSRP